MATLIVQGLTRTAHDAAAAVRGVGFEVAHGRVTALLASPASGARAVLRLISGLDRPDAGEVDLDGVEVTHVRTDRRGIELLTADAALLPGKDVAANVGYALRGAGLAASERAAAVAEALTIFGLTAMAGVRAAVLAEADRRRVALARTLVAHPVVALLDEPFGTVSGDARSVLRRVLREALVGYGATAVLATSDASDAAAVADALVVLAGGRVLQSGAVDDVMAHPVTSGVAALLGYVTLAAGEVQGRYVVEDGVGAILVPPGMPVADRAQVMAHPASLLAVPEGRGLGCGVGGPVCAVRPEGPLHRLDVAIGARMIEVRWEWDLHAPALGTVVELAAWPGTLRLFEQPNGTAMRVLGSAG